MKDQTNTGEESRSKALDWLRDTLSAVLDASPLAEGQTRKTASLIRRLPDRYLECWAEGLGIDYIALYQICPDLPQKVSSHGGKSAVEQRAEWHLLSRMAPSLRRLAGKAISLARQDRLPVSREAVEEEVCALALAGCAPEGLAFSNRAAAILNCGEASDRLLDAYELALAEPDQGKLTRLYDALNRSQYGHWVRARAEVMKRWLHVDTPRFHLRRTERTPQWEQLWQSIFIGGSYGK